MKTSSKQDRSTPRRAVEVRIRITLDHPGKNGYWFGQANDLSEFGMSLFVPTDFEIGTIVRIEFRLPCSSQKLIIRGTIRNRDSFRYGVEFLYPTAAEREAIVRTCKMSAALD